MRLYTHPSYWLEEQKIKNFGDYLSDYLIDKAFYKLSLNTDELRIVGSCMDDWVIKNALDKGKKNLVFWGCGLREEDGINPKLRQSIEILSVRGPKTRSSLKLGDLVPIGDPGLIVPSIYRAKPIPSLQKKSLLVPHFHENRDDALLKEITGCSVILRPNITSGLSNIETFIDQIVAADFVLCGSLHAAIIACAYEKPFGFWDSGSIDLPFKWLDFSESISIPLHFFSEIKAAKLFYEEVIRPSIEIPPLWPMLVAAPFVIRPDILSRVIEVDCKRHGIDVFNQNQSNLTSGKIAEKLESFQLILDRQEGPLLDADIGLHTLQVSALNQAVSERDFQITSLHQSLQKYDQQISTLNKYISEKDNQITELAEEMLRRGDWALGLNSELRDASEKLLSVTSSNSWRLTLPFREMRRWLSSPRQQMQRYIKVGLSKAKRGYQSLPLSIQTKAKHRQFIAKTFPAILRFSGGHPTSIVSAGFLGDTIAETSGSKNSESELGLAGERVYCQLLTSTAPLVSIIIPIFGKIEYTLRCLESIARNKPKSAFEVIIVDDCSPDESLGRLLNVEGIRLLRNEQNLGFIHSCNAGAKAARGGYLCFLNNDTEVSANWLDALVQTFHEFPGTGLVGSKLVYPDGRLQEAGGIIWRNATAWNFGRFQDQQLPVYNYAREVDYCSGASIMVSKALFDLLGGFDEHYSPAYCEDSDLALKVRDRGYRVIYQPLSKVIHYEGITSGTDITKGTKAYQVENTKKLFARWKAILATHQLPGINVDRAKDRRATRRVLVLDHCTPTPDQDSGSIDTYNIMLLLREMDFQVTFIPEDNLLYMHEYTELIQRVGMEALYAPYVTSVGQHLKESGGRYDLVFLFRPGVVGRHIKSIRKYCPQAKVIFHTVDLHFLRMSREAALEADQVKLIASEEMRRFELDQMTSVDMTTVISTEELLLLSQHLPCEKIRLLPYSRHIYGTNKAYADRRDIVFVGGYQHSPNIDAVKYFVQEIMPLLREKLPGIRFHVVGSKPPSEIKMLASEDVIIAGFVKDLRPLLDRMRVSVAPLRYGAGVKGKVGTSMAMGLPVVATALAAEGMSLTDGENILIADGPEATVEAVLKVYQSETIWRQLSENGLAFAEHAWGASAAYENLSAILADIDMNIKPNTHKLFLYTEPHPDQIQSAQHNELRPIGSAVSKDEYIHLLNHSELQRIKLVEKQLLVNHPAEDFTVQGFCVPCDKNVELIVDMRSGGLFNAHGRIPNWRERLECPICQMNNRQRLIATLMRQALSKKEEQQVYLMEQVTPIYNWATTIFKHHKIVGSEYLGHEYPGGSVIKGIRHEDIENLSFADGQLDLIISNDVFEHVPNPAKAFAECARVLKAGGVMLATIPFHSDKDSSVIRARLDNTHVVNILPPAFHGNPVSADGSLVFTDFGWDLLHTMKEAGFSDLSVDIYSSEKHAHLGGGQLVFRAIK